MDPSPVAHEYDSRLWHTRLFLFSYRLWHVFTREYEPGKVERTDICQYIHTLGLMFVALFSQVLLWAGVVGVLAVLPTYLFGAYGIVWFLGILGLVLGGVGILFGGIAGVMIISDYLGKVRGNMRGPRFMKVCRDWIRAKKEKTCWQITIVYPENKKKAAKGEA